MCFGHYVRGGRHSNIWPCKSASYCVHESLNLSETLLERLLIPLSLSLFVAYLGLFHHVFHQIPPSTRASNYFPCSPAPFSGPSVPTYADLIPASEPSKAPQQTAASSNPFASAAFAERMTNFFDTTINDALNVDTPSQTPPPNRPSSTKVR